MSTNFVTKNIKLSLDFDRYVNRKPDALIKVTKGSWIIFTVKGDSKFNAESRSLGNKIVTSKKKVIEARKEGSRWTIQSFVVA